MLDGEMKFTIFVQSWMNRNLVDDAVFRLSISLSVL